MGVGDGVGCDFFERGNICRGDTGCFVGSGCPATVVAAVIPSSPKTIVVGGPSFGAGGRLVSLDLRVIEEGRTSFSGGEIEAVDTGCFVDSGCPTTVAADVISSSPKTMVGGGACFGAAGRLVLLDVRVIEEGRTSFSRGEIEAVCTSCFVGSGFLATVVAEVIPLSPKTMVGGGPCFGAAARLVLLDVWVIEEGRTSFSGGEIEAVDTGCVAGSGFSATVAADVLPSSPKTMVGGGPCFGTAGRLVSLDVWEIEEGRISFSGGEIEAVDTVCVVGSGFPATVIAEVIPSSPKTMVGGGPCFGAASRFVSLDVWVIEEGLSSFSGGEIEAVDTGCVAGSGFPATVVADVIPSSPKPIVGGGPCFGAGRLVSLDVWVIEEERISFSGGEIEAVDTGCVAGSGFPATVVADVIPSSPKTIVGGGPFLGAAGKLVLLDVRVVEEEGRSSPLSFK